MKYNIPQEDPIIEWHAPQLLHHERGRIWYSAAAFVFFFCLGYSLYTKAWTFTIVTLMITAVYWYVHAEKPANKHMRIWKRGFAIDNDYISWGSCIGYWILEGDGYIELCIERKKGGVVKIQTADINPYLIHDTLNALLQELDDRGESLLDTIIRICKL